MEEIFIPEARGIAIISPSTETRNLLMDIVISAIPNKYTLSVLFAHDLEKQRTKFFDRNIWSPSPQDRERKASRNYHVQQDLNILLADLSEKVYYEMFYAKLMSRQNLYAHYICTFDFDDIDAYKEKFIKNHINTLHEDTFVRSTLAPKYTIELREGTIVITDQDKET